MIVSFFENINLKLWVAARSEIILKEDGAKPDAQVCVSFSPCGSAALFLEEEAEMESDCRHCLIAVLLIKRSLCCETPPGASGRSNSSTA